MRLALRVPAGNERGPQYIEQALAAIHQANPDRLPITLEFRRHAGNVTLACSVPDELRAVVETQFFAAYPDAVLEEIATNDPPPPDDQVWELHLHLHREILPIRRFAQFEDSQNRVSADPVTSLLSVLANRGKEPLNAGISIIVRPIQRRRRRRAERCLER